jgi:hypothetical protein
MARLAILDSRVFLQYMNASASTLGKPETTLWEGLLDQWRQRVSNLTIDPRKTRTFHHFFIV